MISEDKKGAMIIIKIALVVFFVLFLVNLIKITDPVEAKYVQWSLLWLFLLGVFAKLKHKLHMRSIVATAGKKAAIKPVLKIKKK